ncbi:MAG TPA: hypothetical protein VL688_05555 [Verrucomicrobiae bacterium]|jgi:hypothetical protein|nr:hypothetical protein [Verrucomicrobiae bacterium]
MISTFYDSKTHTVVIEFAGKVDASEAGPFFAQVEKVVPKQGGFKLLTDMSKVQSFDPELKDFIKHTMEFFDDRGVTDIVRVVVEPSQDIGFNIMSLFHYSPRVKFLTVASRKEAEARLQEV